MSSEIAKKCAAELIGTFWLTLGGCGTAVIAASFPQIGVGLLGVAFAFGLTVLTMAYAIGHISGCHLNPAVTVGLTAGGRFPPNQIVPYIVAQVAGAILAAAVLYLIASGAPNFDVAKGFAANGYGERAAALDMIGPWAERHRVTLGADKAYDTRDFVEALRLLQVTPHVAQNTSNRSSAIDERTTRHPGYEVSQQKRKRIEEIFGWLKTIGLLRQTRHRGRRRVGWMFVFSLAVYNLVRIRNLTEQAA